MAIQTTFTVSTGAHFAIGTKVNLDKGGDIIAASIKMKVILFAVFLSMFLPKTSFAFPVSAGIDYYLFLVSTPPAETVATLNSVETTPDGAETRIPVPQFVPILSGEPPLPTGDRARESVLGRIEYGVPIGGTRSYRTTFNIVVKDNIIGKFECIFVFDVNVKDQAFGPVAVFAKMTANGVDASEFESFASTERCQVAQFARFGPSMILSARRR